METFDLPVEYKGEQQNFKTRLLTLGYIHKLEVDVNGQQIFVEKDDEGNYRAVLADILSEIKTDKGLIKAIVETVEKLLE